MRRIAALSVVVFGIGFLWLIGYAVKTAFADFGTLGGLLATACTIAGFLSLAFLLDTRQPPPR
jgi:hypothetical protein